MKMDGETFPNWGKTVNMIFAKAEIERKVDYAKHH